MSLDSLTNTYLGVRKSKYGDQAQLLPKMFFSFSSFFLLLEFWLQLVRRGVILAIFDNFKFCTIFFSLLQKVFLAGNIKIRDIKKTWDLKKIYYFTNFRWFFLFFFYHKHFFLICIFFIAKLLYSYSHISTLLFDPIGSQCIGEIVTYLCLCIYIPYNLPIVIR